MESELAPQGLDANDNNIAHLREEEKALINKRTESQKQINQTKFILADLY